VFELLAECYSSVQIHECVLERKDSILFKKEGSQDFVRKGRFTGFCSKRKVHWILFEKEGSQEFVRKRMLTGLVSLSEKSLVLLTKQNKQQFIFADWYVLLCTCLFRF
jgi:hypothetical protein